MFKMQKKFAMFANFDVKSATKKKHRVFMRFCHPDVQNIKSIEFLTVFAKHLFQNCKSQQGQMFKNSGNFPPLSFFQTFWLNYSTNAVSAGGFLLSCLFLVELPIAT